MELIFAQYQSIIVFLHVISAVVWVGGMIAIRFSAHYALAQLEGPQRLARTAHMLNNLFKIVVPFVLLLLLTALIMALAMDLHQSELKVLTFAKEGIWSVMALNLGMMILRRNKAQRFIDAGDFANAKSMLGPIGTLMVPINITLGVVAIFLGVLLRF
ncbi:MAG: hypothetical protein IBX45_02980 [Campylobacterales bacterium]|nr:hypothetical protein [Campylobacterales bacterium]